MPMESNPLAALTDLFGVAPTITTGVGLAALSVIAAFLLARSWLSGQQAMLQHALDTGDHKLLDKVSGGISVPLGDLTAQQQYDMTMTQLRQSWVLRLVLYTFSLFAFLALLTLIGALAYRDVFPSQQQQASSEAASPPPSVTPPSEAIAQTSPPERESRQLRAAPDIERESPAKSLAEPPRRPEVASLVPKNDLPIATLPTMDFGMIKEGRAHRDAGDDISKKARAATSGAEMDMVKEAFRSWDRRSTDLVSDAKGVRAASDYQQVRPAGADENDHYRLWRGEWQILREYIPDLIEARQRRLTDVFTR
jgi:hypothetical protein